METLLLLQPLLLQTSLEVMQCQQLVLLMVTPLLQVADQNHQHGFGQ